MASPSAPTPSASSSEVGTAQARCLQRREFCQFADTPSFIHIEAPAEGRGGCGGICDFADTLSPPLLKRLLNGRGGCSGIKNYSPAGGGGCRSNGPRRVSSNSASVRCFGPACSRRGSCCSAAPPSTFSRRFNTDGEGVSAAWQSRWRLGTRRHEGRGGDLVPEVEERLSAREFCQFAGAPSPSLLTRLPQEEGGAAEWLPRRRLGAPGRPPSSTAGPESRTAAAPQGTQRRQPFGGVAADAQGTAVSVACLPLPMLMQHHGQRHHTLVEWRQVRKERRGLLPAARSPGHRCCRPRRCCTRCFPLPNFVIEGQLDRRGGQGRSVRRRRALSRVLCCGLHWR